MGMLFELGPCNIVNEGKDTMFNPHSWNTYSNMLFLDQPVYAGYSSSRALAMQWASGKAYPLVKSIGRILQPAERHQNLGLCKDRITIPQNLRISLKNLME